MRKYHYLQVENGRAARRLRREDIQAQIVLLDYPPANPWFVIHFLRHKEFMLFSAVAIEGIFTVCWETKQQ
jgi:hypothetical protein